MKKFYKEVIDVNATEIATKESGKSVTSNIYILGLASARGLLPIKRDILLKTIEQNVPKKYFDINKRMFELAK